MICKGDKGSYRKRPIGALQCFLKKHLQNFLAMDLLTQGIIFHYTHSKMGWSLSIFMELSSYEKYYKKAEQEGQVTASACW